MKVLVKNRKATFNYEILEQFTAGIVLEGCEVKSIMSGKCSLAEGFVSAKDGIVLLKQVHVDRYSLVDGFSNKISETRERKLLLNKHEIRKLERKATEKGLTIIPTAIIYSDTKKIKIEIAICRGKKTHDKRQVLRQKQTEREMNRDMKNAYSR